MEAYPSIGQSIGLTFIIIGSMLVFAILNFILNDIIGHEASMFVYYLISIGLPAFLLQKHKNKKNGPSNYNFAYTDFTAIFLIMLISLGIQFGLASPLTSLIPMSDWIKEAFMQIAEMNGILGFLTIAVLAPVLEEWIFRGIVLEGLLKNTSPWKAILISSILFGIVHLNPWQFIGATIIGIFLGWIYYRTGNLLYCMIIHFANNAFAFLLMSQTSAEEMMNETLAESYGGEGNMLVIIPASILVIIGGVFYLNKHFPKKELIQQDEAVEA